MLPAKTFFRFFVLLPFLLWLHPAMAFGISDIIQNDTGHTVQAIPKKQDSLIIVRNLQNALHKIEQNKTFEAEQNFFKTVDSTVRFAKKTGLLVTAGWIINKIGEQLRNESRYSLALHMHRLAVKIGKETNNYRLLMFSNNDIGVVYRRIDNYQKAMEYHLKALRLATLHNDSANRAIAVNSIGNVYVMLNNYDKALAYFKKSLQLEKNRNNPIGIAINFDNIAHVYEEKGYLSKALKYYELSLNINRKIDSKRGVAICSNDIANLLKKEGKYQEALVYSETALRIAAEIKDYENLAYAYINTGALYSALKKYKKALEYLHPGIALARKIRARSVLEEGYKVLSNTYLATKNYPKAIQYLKLKQAYHDSLTNLEVKKNIARLQIQFDIERQKNLVQLEQQKTKIAILQLKKQKYLLYLAWTAFAILLIVLAFVVLYLLNKNRQTRLLLEKTHAIEKAEKELKKSNRALQEAIKKAETSARAKTDFLANISHEIRTPLNSVIGFSDLLFSLTSDEKQKDYLKSIKSSGEALLNLINDILDLSKIEEGNIELEMKETDIRAIIADVTGIFSLEASGKGLRLFTEIEQNVPQCLVFEEARLRQILLNLVGNAIKFTSKGSVTIRVSVRPETEKDEVLLKLEVRDTGMGISPKDRDLIFEPFHQVNTSKKTQGTGLGLAITRRMIQALDGEINLESTPGKGSCFTVLFHHVELCHDTEKALSGQPPAEVQGTKTCLFINESHPDKEEFVKMFQAFGFSVEDVGLNLAYARKVMNRFRLVVFCCLSEDVLKNSLNFFEKENFDGRHVFLVLNINDNEPVEITNGFYISLYDRSKEWVKDALRSFFRRFEEDETARQLFVTEETFPDDMFLITLQKIFKEEYARASQTKMFDNIALFVERIRTFSDRYHLVNLRVFAQNLDEHLKNFDIVFIEKQMHVFEKAYTLIMNTR